MYLESKADRLVKEFGYLVNVPYYPFGKKGREFLISEIKIYLPPLRTSSPEFYASSQTNPNYKEERLAAHSQGKNWKVKVVVSNENDKIELDLGEVLKKLNIKHNIDEAFN